MAIEIGRVQGASIFYTTVTLDTENEFEISTLGLTPATTELTPFVGDSIRDGNNNVYTIKTLSEGKIILENEISIKGDKGDTGEQGIQGDKGDTPTITLGETKTGEAGTDAAVEIADTDTGIELTFTIPRGDKGDSTTAILSETGDTRTPIYINSSGTPTVCSDTVGSGTTPIYMSSGTLTASTSTVGDATNPIYLENGIFKDVKSSYSTTLNSNSWEQISQASKSGIAPDLWSVGATKSITLGGSTAEGTTMGTLTLSNSTWYVYILGFNHNAGLEGDNTIHFGTFNNGASISDSSSICLIDGNYSSSSAGSTKYFNMNHWGSTSSSPYNTNYGGWSACDMRYDILGSTDVAPSVYGSVKTTGCYGHNPTYTCTTSPVSGTLMACLPKDLRDVMRPVTKWTDNVGNASGNVPDTVTATVDYLPLLSEYEVYGNTSYNTNYSNKYERMYQQQYDYYAYGNSRIKYRHSSTGSTARWWLRSPYYSYVAYFCYATTNGSSNFGNSGYSIGVAPAFIV